MSILQSTSNKQNFYRTSEGKHDLHAPFVDKFTLFSWRGKNSWRDYGCFITNSGSDLHWLGQETQDSYTTPLFGSNAQTLTAVTFNSPKIELNLALYGVTAKEYRDFFTWLDPLVIDKLYFWTDLNYYYIVKPQQIGRGVKNIIGYEGLEPLYYVETSVSFALQGEICGWGDDIIVWECNHDDHIVDNTIWTRNSVNNNNIWDIIDIKEADWISDLRNSLQIQFQLPNILSYWDETNNTTEKQWLQNVKVYIAPVSLQDITTTEKELIWDQNSQILLLDLSFDYKERMGGNNPQTDLPSSWYNFVYDSADGLLYRTQDKQLITLTSDDLLTNLLVNKILLPSKIQDQAFYNDIYNKKVRDIGIQIMINDRPYYFNKSHYVEGEHINNTTLYNNISSYVEIHSLLKTPVI